MNLTPEMKQASPIKLWVVFENGKSITFHCGFVRRGKTYIKGSLSYGLDRAKKIVNGAKDPVSMARIYNTDEPDPKKYICEYANNVWR